MYSCANGDVRSFLSRFRGVDRIPMSLQLYMQDTIRFDFPKLCFRLLLLLLPLSNPANDFSLEIFYHIPRAQWHFRCFSKLHQQQYIQSLGLSRRPAEARYALLFQVTY